MWLPGFVRLIPRLTCGLYARVSTTDQSLQIQEAALKAAGCEVIRSEKRSGTTTTGRAELRTVLDFLRHGDVLVVTRIDRLARSIGDLQDIVRAVKAKGATLKATEQPIDTSTAAGKCFLDMLGVFAEFETNLRKERQMEGIAKAKAAGVYRGRPASIDPAQVQQLKAWGLRRLQRSSALVARQSTGHWSSYVVSDPILDHLRGLCLQHPLPLDAKWIRGEPDRYRLGLVPDSPAVIRADWLPDHRPAKETHQ
jgi:DNA invertase Pin-like site-specific DNA recombinase